MAQTTSDPNRRPHAMRVITGGRAAVAQSRDEALEFVVSTRAGDRLEPWALPSSPAVTRVLEQAAGAGLDPELAVRLCVEHALVRATLCAVRVDPRLVDALASGQRFEQRADDRDAPYARRLTLTATRAERPATPSTVGLPLRLAGQLADADLAALLRDADVEQARAWELAALADGRTMSEWAPVAALRAQSARLRA